MVSSLNPTYIVKASASSKQIDYNSYFLIFCVLLFSSSASIIAKSDIAIIVATSYGIVLNIFGKNFKKYLLSLAAFFALFSLIIFIYYLKNNSSDIYTWAGLFSKIVLTYNAAFYCKKNFDMYFIKLVYTLGTISLFLYTFQLINFNLLYNVNNLFGMDEIRGLEANSNSLIFNLVKKHSTRNCGFMWEPGAYAAVLIIGLMLTFRINNKVDKVKTVLIICLITTLSTTGYISLFIILVYFFYKKLKAYSLLLVIPILYLLMNMEFITDKIAYQLNSVEDELSSTQHSVDYTIHLNRFASMYADYNTFIENPILGLGIDLNSTGKKEYYKEYDENVVRTSGIMFSLVKFGLLGLVLYLILVYRRNAFRYSDNKFAIFFCAIILIELISNPLDYSTLLLAFLFI